MSPKHLPTILCLLLATGLAPLQAVAAPRPTDGFADPTTPPQYERPRTFDLEHTLLELSFEFDSRSVQGRVVHRIRPFRDDLTVVTFDQHRMTFSRVGLLDGPDLAYALVGDSILVTLPPLDARPTPLEIELVYRAVKPSQGLHWNIPDADYPDRPRQVWSQGQSEENHFWFPTVDRPNERMTTEQFFTVPNGLQALGNGEFVESTPNADGTTTWHYRLDFPHAPYLVSVVVGDFAVTEQVGEGIPLLTYTPRKYASWADPTVATLPAMMGIFTERFGPYPFTVFRESFIEDYLYGGMENITNVTLHTGALHPQAVSEGYSAESLLAHELGHQWWGVWVALRDWDDTWLNEGFADYCEMLYWEDAYGVETRDWYLLQELGSYLRSAKAYRRPMSTQFYEQPDDTFDSVAYNKGAVFLHMLRSRLGDAVFFSVLDELRQSRGGKPTDAEDLRRAIEALTGDPMEGFFDQWVNHGGHPELSVSWDWEADTRLLHVSVKQTQTVDDLTPLFALTAPIVATFPGSSQRYTVHVEGAEQEFYLAAAERPDFVEFDPEGTVIKDLTLRQGTASWVAQLQRAQTLPGRVQAARALAQEDGASVEDALAELLNSPDAFWGLRGEAALALGKLGTSRATDALLAAVDSEPMRVRMKVAEALGTSSDDRVLSALRALALHDPSPLVAESAVDAITVLDAPGSSAALREALKRKEAWRDDVRRSALQGLATLEVTDALPAVEALAVPGVPADTRGQALRTAAALANALPEKDPARKRVRKLIEGQLEDNLLAIRRNAASALGTLGDPDARPALERARDREDYPSVTQAAKRALAAISRAQGRREAPASLREDLDSLRRDHDGLKRDLERVNERLRVAQADTTQAP